jgi:hypothetical protein
MNNIWSCEELYDSFHIYYIDVSRLLQDPCIVVGGCKSNKLCFMIVRFLFHFLPVLYLKDWLIHIGIRFLITRLEHLTGFCNF